MRIGIILCAVLVVVSCSTAPRGSFDSTQADKDIAKLLKAAAQVERAWEWEGAVPEVALVARHGKQIAPRLLKLLDHGPDASTFDDLHVDQQVQLVLCTLFGEQPRHARTIYFVRTFEKENQQVKKFWEDRVSQYHSQGD